MAKIIEFYLPTRHRARRYHYLPADQRGRVLPFPEPGNYTEACHTRQTETELAECVREQKRLNGILEAVAQLADKRGR